MKRFRDIKALTRIQILINLVFTILFLITAIIYYIEKKGRLEQTNANTIERDLDELIQFVDNQLKRDKDVLTLAVNISEIRINDYSSIEISDSGKTSFRAIDPYTNEPMDVSIEDWQIDGFSLVNNYQVVDELKKITNADVAIYQVCDKGYVNVSTSQVNTSRDRLVGDIILNSSPIARTIESGNQFLSRMHRKGAWFTVSYRPIFVDGKIKGIYYVGIRERMGAALKNVFEHRKYFKTGYPFVLADNGNLLIHPTRQGEDLSSTELFKNIIRNGKSNQFLSYNWPETGQSKIWNLHYKYHEAIQSFVCVSYPVRELYATLYLTFAIAAISYVLFMLLLQILIVMVLNALKIKLKNLRQLLNRLARGEKIVEVNLAGEKEFVQIAQEINEISKRQADLASFAKELANDNFSQTYPKSFLNDEIGESLIKINDKLNEAMYNEHIRQKEEKLRSWESEGLSKFVNILQRNRDKLDELCYELISNLVEYLNANMGALFFLNNENPNDIHFMQMATYAFEQRKTINKKIYPEQGLIGRVYNEKQTIFLSELPEDYITIASGLGKGIPKNLLIVPLFINKEVYGVIEIASFSILKGYQIEFIEKIGENIASTINNVLVNNKTHELLAQSRAQSLLLSEQEEKMRMNLLELKNIQQEAESDIYEMRDSFKLLEDILLMVELSVEGEIQMVNHCVSRFFSMEKSILIGKHYSDYSNLIPVDEYKTLINSWDRLLEGKKVQIEIKVKSGGGKMKSVLLNMIPEFEKDKISKIVLIAIELSKVAGNVTE